MGTIIEVLPETLQELTLYIALKMINTFGLFQNVHIFIL